MTEPAEPGKTPWGTAAVVWAFTRDGGQGEYQQKRKSEVLTTGEFSGLGIRGLKSDNSVRKYRQAWQHAIDEGLVKPAEPGKTHWGTAAIVWAFTEPGTNQHKVPVKKFTGSLTITDFAALGIRGLSSRPSVIKYRQAWQHAIDGGCEETSGNTNGHCGNLATKFAGQDTRPTTSANTVNANRSGHLRGRFSTVGIARRSFLTLRAFIDARNHRTIVLWRETSAVFR